MRLSIGCHTTGRPKPAAAVVHQQSAAHQDEQKVGEAVALVDLVHHLLDAGFDCGEGTCYPRERAGGGAELEKACHHIVGQGTLGSA